jgi:7-carboxy-7-deazaguanine synthase
MKFDTPVHELYPAIQAEGSRAGRPTVIVRTTGCTHRCFFGEGGWCDAWQSSIHPEKACYNFSDIIDIYEQHPQIREMMLTGGSPTMHPEFVNKITQFCAAKSIFLTMETEGSHFVKTDYPIDLISLSPKFSNSIPKIGMQTPQGNVVNESFIKQHNKHRLNYEAIFKLLDYHKDYHYKPVWGGDAQTLGEIEEFRVICNIPKEKTWLMPAGDNRETLFETYKLTMEKSIELGYNWTGRPHIIAYNKQRYV